MQSLPAGGGLAVAPEFALERFEQVAAGVAYHPSRITLVSSLSAEPFVPCARYWREHAHQAMEFACSPDALVSLNCTVCLEVGPSPVLMDQVAAQLPSGLNVMAMLSRHCDDWTQTLDTLGALYSRGYQPDWKAFHASSGAQRVKLPIYAWDHPVALSTGPVSTNPYLSNSANVAAQCFVREDTGDVGQIRYLKRLVASHDVYLEHHRLFGHIVAPGAMHVAMLIAVFKDFHNDRLFSLKDVIFLQPLRFEDDEEREIKVEIHPSTEATVRYTLSSRRVLQQDAAADSCQGWMTHLEGYAVSDDAAGLEAEWVEPLTAALFQQSRQFDPRAFYQDFKNRGYDLGKEYRWLQQGTFNRHLCICSLANPLATNTSGEYPLSPGLIDSCFQMIGVSLTADTAIMETGDIYIPFHIENITVHPVELSPGSLISQARVTQGNERSNEVCGTIRLQSSHDEPIFDIQGFSAKKVEGFVPESPRSEATKLLYHTVWKRIERATQDKLQEQPNYWLIFGDDNGVASQLVSLLRKGGAECLLIRREEAAEYALAADSVRPSLIASLLARVPATGKRVGVAYLWGVDAPDAVSSMEQAAQHLLEPLLRIVRECAEYEQAEAIRKVVIVTRASQTLDGSRLVDSLLPASLWCAARVAANEQTSLSTLSIDLGISATEADIALLAHCMSTSTGKEEYAIREETLYVPGLVARSANASMEDSVLKPDATYLVTGGFGDLGMFTAQALIEQGAEHILLIGRKAPTTEQLARLDSMVRPGTNIVTYCCDIGDSQGLELGLVPTLAALPPLKGIVHAAGINDDALVLNETWEHFWQVAQSKVAGAWNLHELSHSHELDFFILYSSIASILGPAGQAAYASANGYMDALAQYRHTLGAPALSINWGGWSATGMMARVSQRNIDRMQKVGIELLQPESGFALMKKMLGTVDEQWIVASLNEKKIKANVQRADFPLVLKRMNFLASSLMASGETRDVQRAGDMAVELDEAGIRRYLTSLMASTLLEAIDVSQHQKSLVSLGLDSMMALEIKTCIKNDTGVDIPILKLLEGASIDFLCTLISSQVAPIEQAGDAHQPQNATRRVRIEL
ncbi:SDR family NAD(P)-dependent oxidoreductase [Pseudomonas sp. S75]|uniref:SDR family NAD(P)-dependent oxidoreductase n=1 Tax=unclassified Pseudomonas TaxID=196821 RepID=UPI00190946C2|nr:MULTISPECIES: SDR family NAD(P)-dependent oxidoreductase [unclassified Pseudomonas]MBJ9978492.1 SDR family NAD(P)-dependent oxidoreductase [Pseudomonas sp. S30]MBK0156469.1 SDR family NAD(P)-dependent oxidoreductase [Pseudomonas sp. S75]